tara:strand:- start:11445 stop:13877 length:2433 start_codon:yes stop_codon:yes gene_type:complete
MALYKDETAGRSLQKSFNRIGIRRDQDFSDLSSPSEGLTNLIDTLINDNENTFVADDLKVIKNIFANGLTNEGYLNIAGSAEKFVSPDGQSEEFFDPRITYQNRLDKIKVFSGEPRLAGGNGLTAKYYQNDQINFDEHANFEYNVNPNLPEADIFVGVTTNGLLPDDNFWEEGDFAYSTKIHPQSAKSNTGVKWEGYFIPTITGPVNFQVTSTGYFTMDFQQVGYQENNNKNIISPSGIGTYTEHMRVGISTIFQVSAAAAGNDLTVDSSLIEKMNTIGIGMSVTGNSNIVNGAVIESFSKANQTITLVSDSTNSITGAITNQNLTFFRDLNNSTPLTHSITTQVLEAYQKYRIRYRYFHHKNFDSKDIVQSIDFNYKQRNFASTADLRYTSLFSLDYNFSNAVKGVFNKYNDNSVLFGGTNTSGIGTDIGSQNAEDYVKVSTNNKVDIKYVPKQNLTQITRSEISVIKTGGSTVLELSSGVMTTNIEVGNYVIGVQDTTIPSIPFFARVKSILDNEFVILDLPVFNSGTATETVRFINHRGFVRRVRVGSTSNSPVITRSASTNPFRPNPISMSTRHRDVQVGMIAIGANIPSFTKVDLIADNGESLTLSTNVSMSANQDVFFYDSKGLRDNSLQNFCDRIDNTPTVQCLISDVDSTLNQGVGIVTVTDAKNVAIGWELQGSYFGENGITVTNVQGTTITLNTGITRSLPNGAQFTAVEPSKNTVDYTLCCPPTDTSPPFNASDEGLNTIPTHKDLGIVSGNLKFDSLIIQDNSSSNNATDLTTGQSTDVNRTIDIKTPTGTFKILATT